jgi:TolA-binding protein
MNPKKKPISREEWLVKHQQRAWEGDISGYDEFSQEAIEGLQYQGNESSPAQSLEQLRNRMGITTGTSTQKVLSLKRIMSIAAGFLVLVLGAYFIYMMPPSANQLFAQHFSYLPTAMQSVDRSADVPQASGLKDSAIKAYASGNYQEAEGLFRAYLSEVPNDTEMKFYYGIVLLGKGETEGAIPLIRQMRAAPAKSSYYRPASWYLALAYLRHDKEALARPLLEELIADGSDDRYAISASSILKKL